MTKKLTALCLILAMCFTLAACGGGDTPQAGTDTQNTQSGEHPEYVYTAEFDTFMKDSETYFYPRVATNDGYYITSYEKTGTFIPEGVTPEYEGQYDVYQSMLYFCDKNGKISKLENFKALEVPENTEGYEMYSASADIAGLAADSEGKLISVDQVYISWYEGDDSVARYSDDYWMNMKYEQKYFVRRLDTDGTELSRAEIPTGSEEYLNVWGMKLDKDNNVLVSTDTGIRAINPDTGEDAYIISTPGYVDNFLQLGDGRLAISSYGENGQSLAILDTENRTVGEQIDVRFDLYNCVPGDSEYDLYYTSGTNFYGYKWGEEPVKLFNWLSCDVNCNMIVRSDVQPDGSVVSFVNEWSRADNTYSCERVTVSKKPYDSVPHKEIITMAGMYMGGDFVDDIVKFNRRSDKYRIEVTDYSEYNNEQDGWDAGLTKLNTEIMAGNVPDILMLNGLNYTQLAAKGLLEDLYPYIDADPELSRDDFFQNVLDAASVDGKLCATVSGFSINGVAGAASVVGDTAGWTYDELQAALATMPEGCTVFDKYMTKDSILTSCLALDMDDFVDWSTGKCSFDSQQFIDLLEFANSFPAEYDWENTEGESTYDRIMQGRQMLLQFSVYSIEDLMYNNFQRYFGGDVTYIGFPTLNGTGNMIQLDNNGFAMSAKSPYKDVIWEFLRTFFTEKYQQDTWNLPSNRKVFEAKLKDACTVQYQQDENGNYTLDEKGEKIPVVKYYLWDEQEQKDKEYYCMDEETAQQLRELVSTTTKVANYDSSIFEIVREQVQAYFEGQRSAEDVAKLIQSKANIFVNEQR